MPSAGRRLALIAPLVLVVIAAFAAPSWADDRDEWQQPERVMADLHLEPGSTVVDVGCGWGYFTFRLSDAVGPDGLVYAMDIDPGAVGGVLEQAKARAAANVIAMLSQPTSTTLQPESIDAAFICNVLHEMPMDDRAPLLGDVARVLRPGGFLFLIDWRKSREVPFDAYEQLIPRDELVRLAEGAGLVLDAEFHYLRYQVFLRFRKPPSG